LWVVAAILVAVVAGLVVAGLGVVALVVIAVIDSQFLSNGWLLLQSTLYSFFASQSSSPL
jgi:hypothetical protein